MEDLDLQENLHGETSVIFTPMKMCFIFIYCDFKFSLFQTVGSGAESQFKGASRVPIGVYIFTFKFADKNRD